MSTENTLEERKARTPGGFGVTVETLTPTEQDIRVLSAQLGRKVRDVIEIPARCVCGNPLVAATAPRLSNGTPFPTVFYLAHPVITAAASRLEAGGLMYEMTDSLAEDADLAAQYAALGFCRILGTKIHEDDSKGKEKDRHNQNQHQ